VFARVLATLVEEIEEQSGVTILNSSYAPCVKQFPGFGLLEMEALFESLYVKQGFSVDI
jgi:hypothetical protein